MLSNRNQGIDLLRIILTFYVCLLHILGQGGALEASLQTSNYYSFWFLNVLAYCAVDGYALISGYISQSKHNNYSRIIIILLESFFYSFVLTCILSFFKIGSPLEKEEMIKLAFPFIFGGYWYIAAYFPLFFLMPYINMAVENMMDKHAKELFVILLVIFSCFGIMHDNWLNNGSSFCMKGSLNDCS